METKPMSMPLFIRFRCLSYSLGVAKCHDATRGVQVGLHDKKHQFSIITKENCHFSQFLEQKYHSSQLEKATILVIAQKGGPGCHVRKKNQEHHFLTFYM